MRNQKPRSASEKLADKKEIELLREKTFELAKQKPDKAAKILTFWIHEKAGAGKKKTKKAA